MVVASSRQFCDSANDLVRCCGDSYKSQRLSTAWGRSGGKVENLIISAGLAPVPVRIRLLPSLVGEHEVDHSLAQKSSFALTLAHFMVASGDQVSPSSLKS